MVRNMMPTNIEVLREQAYVAAQNPDYASNRGGVDWDWVNAELHIKNPNTHSDILEQVVWKVAAEVEA